jgi:hypothetical protein
MNELRLETTPSSNVKSEIRWGIGKRIPTFVKRRAKRTFFVGVLVGVL